MDIIFCENLGKQLQENGCSSLLFFHLILMVVGAIIQGTCVFYFSPCPASDPRLPLMEKLP